MEVGIVQGGVRARVVERQIVRHLTHLIPYLTLSPVTTLIHPFPSAALQPDPLTLRAPSTPVALRLAHLFIVLHPLHPLVPPLSPLVRPFSSAATASKALDYLPLISARVAHLLPRLPRLPRPKDQPPPLSSHALFRPSFSTLHLYFLPATTLDRLVPAVLPSFLRSVSKHLTAILINALTLLLHNYAHPLLDSNNTIS